MNPLLLFGGAAAVGALALSKKAKPAAPAVHPEIAKAATGLARSRIAKGATPEEAAEWAAEKIAEQGGGFWKDKGSADGAVRF